MFDLFSKNFLKANADKCQLIASSKIPVDTQVSDFKVNSESRVKFLGIHVDNRFNFDYHVNELCKKATKKLHALARIFKYVETAQGPCKLFYNITIFILPSNLDVSQSKNGTQDK